MGFVVEVSTRSTIHARGLYSFSLHPDSPEATWTNLSPSAEVAVIIATARRLHCFDTEHREQVPAQARYLRKFSMFCDPQGSSLYQPGFKKTDMIYAHPQVPHKRSTTMSTIDDIMPWNRRALVFEA